MQAPKSNYVCEVKQGCAAVVEQTLYDFAWLQERV